MGAGTLANQLAPGGTIRRSTTRVLRPHPRCARDRRAAAAAPRRADRRARRTGRRTARRARGAAAAAIIEERARLAIGVHDALAQRVGEITLQAAGAQRVAGEDPDRALVALARIEAAARGALDDIRTVIGVLRAGDDLVRGRADVPGPMPTPWRDRAPRRAGSEPGPRRLRAVAERYGDAALAVAVFLALTIEVLASSRQEGSWPANVLGCAAIAAPLVLRRSRPLLSAIGVCAAAAVQSLLLTPLELLVTPIVLLIIPTYSVAAHLPWRPALAGLALCVLLTIPIGPAQPSVLIAVLAFAAGRAGRDRALRAAVLHAINGELERSRDAHAARARAEERLRISRELHDAVAHRMTVIVLQAGAARRVWGHDAAAARIAVEALTGVARETLSDLRAALRGAGPARVDRLDELVARVRPLGLDVTITREGDTAPAGPRASGLRRGPGGPHQRRASRRADDRGDRDPSRRRRPARHRLGRRTPPGPPRTAAPVAGSGTGLQGMTERVEAVGGTLRYGGDGPGFRVEARLPLEAVPVA